MKPFFGKIDPVMDIAWEVLLNFKENVFQMTSPVDTGGKLNVSKTFRKRP